MFLIPLAPKDPKRYLWESVSVKANGGYESLKQAGFVLAVMLIIGVTLPSCVREKCYQICILQWGEAQPYYEAYKGLIDGFLSKGYEEGRNLEIKYAKAKGDYNFAKDAVRRWEKLKPNLIISIGTKATLAAKEVLHPENSNIPLLFTTCAFPNITGIIGSYSPQKGITGIGAEIPTKERIDLLLKTFPKIKRVGIPYFTFDPQAVITATKAKKLLEDRGITAIALVLSKDKGINATIEKIGKLAEKCEFIYLPTDPILYVPKMLKGIISVTMRAGVQK